MTIAGRLMVRLWGVVVLASLSTAANADVVGIKFTAEGLGLGHSDLNEGFTVDPDKTGFVTSNVTGEGSILSIQTNGKAGNGTTENPLLLTVTASEHLDTLYGVPEPSDYQAGVIYISDENGGYPDGYNEGIGVRAFSVVGETGLRKTDWHNGRAKIEGSREISGGTDPEIVYDPDDPNGPPHVDEAVQFTFDDDYDVSAKSVEILLSKFSLHEVIDLGLQVNLESGISTTISYLGTDDSDIFEQVGDYNDKLWRLKFSGIDGLDDDDLIRSFEIRAIEDSPWHPSETAEHFMIASLTASYTDADHGGGGGGPPSPVVPEPSSIMVWLLLGMSLSGVRWWRRRR